MMKSHIAGMEKIPHVDFRWRIHELYMRQLSYKGGNVPLYLVTIGNWIRSICREGC